MKVIQLELNEVSKKIIDQLIAKKELPHFKYVNEHYTYITTYSDSTYEHIEPWIQWVCAHTGKTYDEHKVFHLGDAHQLSHPQIWDVLEKNGFSTAIIGSMNIKANPKNNGIFFPDPWAKQGETRPKGLQQLWKLISSKVQTHATSQLTLKDTLTALRCCFKYRIPTSLYFKIAKQLVAQKFNPKKKWRMAGLFDELLAHLFLTILNTTDYNFYTLFLNACAHYQHHYWRDFDPQLFNQNIQTPDIVQGDNPVKYGYKLYDKVLGLIFNYICSHKDTALIITTAFTQEPFLKCEDQGGMNYYRLNDHQGFLDLVGLNQAKAYPLMSRDWQIMADNLDQVKQILESITIDNEPLFSVEHNNKNTLFVYTQLTRTMRPQDSLIIDNKVLGKFGDLFTNIAIKSGHHIPEGSLWLSPNIAGKAPSEDQIPLTELFKITQDIFDLKEKEAA